MVIWKSIEHEIYVTTIALKPLIQSWDDSKLASPFQDWPEK